MTLPKKDTGFDAFFDAITASPEFKAAVTKDWKGPSLSSLETSLKEMESGVAKASDIMSAFEKEFGGKGETAPASAEKRTGDAKEEEKYPVDVQHFTIKDPAMWGFAGVAGMEKLKTELRESFIKPLRFKFLIEKIRTEREKPRTEWSLGKDDALPLSHELLEKLYTEYEKFKISIPTGMLFYWPPWTGKTFVTKKLAEELGCWFISKNMWEFGSSYLHQTTKNIRDFFEWAKHAAEKEPIILFLDEIDSIVSARTNNIDANKAEEVSQFLQEFNSLESAKNLIVIAATNRPDHLDPAILRSGRLDKKVYLWPPDFTARKELFRMYIERVNRPHTKLDYDALALMTEWYVSADIEAICDEVARDASRNLLELIDDAESGKLKKNFEKWHAITMDQLETTIKETPSSLKVVDMSIYENWLEKIQK